MKHYDVVAAVVTSGEKVLCVQKGATKFPYTSFRFEFPGGKIEPGETPAEALRRELREEMEMEAIVDEHLVTVEHEYPDFAITLRAYRCHLAAPGFRLREHQAFLWLMPEELPGLSWAAADEGIVAALLQKP